jgi:hypothetical protein
LASVPGFCSHDKLDDSRRRAVGFSLVALGIATTIPAARKLFGRHTDMAVTS